MFLNEADGLIWALCPLGVMPEAGMTMSWWLALTLGQGSSGRESRGRQIWWRGQKEKQVGSFCFLPNAFLGGTAVKNLPDDAGDARSSGEGNGTHSSILACDIPWTEEPGGLQPMGSHTVGHN